MYNKKFNDFIENIKQIYILLHTFIKLYAHIYLPQAKLIKKSKNPFKNAKSSIHLQSIAHSSKCINTPPRSFQGIQNYIFARAFCTTLTLMVKFDFYVYAVKIYTYI